MALVSASIGSILAPVIESLIGSAVTAVAGWLFTKLKGKVKEITLEEELDKAIRSGKVEKFIKDYEEHLSKSMIEKIRAIANLRDLFDKTERIINSRTYKMDTVDVFIDLARILEDVMIGVTFEEAGIKLNVQDVEMKEEILVTSEEYMVALLFRFAAAVCTQLAKKLTPSMEGWALEYDASIKLDIEKVRIKTRGPPSRAEMMMGNKFLAFREKYLDLIDYYKDGRSIRDKYLDSVSCLKTAQMKVTTIRDTQEIHKYMNPSHLEGLVLGFRGEAQFWQFNISEELTELAESVRNLYESDSKQVEEWLDHMGVKKGEEEFNEFLDCLNLYKNIGDGFAGALKLYKDAIENSITGKDKDMMKNRIKKTEKLASNNPAVLVPDPKPIL